MKIKHLNQGRIQGGAAAILATVLALSGQTVTAQQTRVLGIDVSAWQGNIAASNWEILKRPTDQQVNGVFGDGRDFVFIRSSRGGTTGIDKRAGGFPSSDNDEFQLSQRYDDPYFVQNITRATAAGLLAGSYHFARPDIVATTQNAGGIANTGVDEANHMIQMAGAWMRPGYLLPVFDLEAGINERSQNALVQFCNDFSDRIFEVTGVRPIMYINGAYASDVQGSSDPQSIVSKFPVLWVARYANQSDPNSIPIQTGHPKDTYSPIYGPWDDAPHPTHPWNFWQYASTARLNGYAGGGANIDVNVAQGGMEFLKDHLVPALWMNNSSGQWTAMTNWNSGETPVAPVQGPGQVPRVGTLVLPTPRLPATDDTVILDRPNANITVTLASGTQNVRKLYVREALNITGGTLNVRYVPSWDSTPISAQFSSPVSLGGTGTLAFHTLQVDAGQTFTWSGGTAAFNTIRLTPHSSSPAKILVNGNVTIGFTAIYHGLPVITNAAGSGSSGTIDLVGGNRTFNVPTVNLAIGVPIVNGGLTKSGTGTLRLAVPSTYAGGTTVSAGRLWVNNTTGSGTGTGAVAVNGGILGGSGRISGHVTVNAGGTILPGTGSAIETLTLNNGATLGGTTFMKVNRNNGSPLNDKLVVNAGTLNLGGMLVISNLGAAFTGGEVFPIFSSGNYSGSFSGSQLPSLAPGLNWYLGDLGVNGSIKVNRSPSGGLITMTNKTGLEIPFASLLAVGTDLDGDSLSVASINLTTTNGVALTTNGTTIFYSNPSNVADQFTYVLSDGRGGSAMWTVRILPSPEARFTASPDVSSSSVAIQFSGAPGSTYFVERSTNLTLWTTISTNTVPGSGLFDFTDLFPDVSEVPPAAYYRIRW